MQVNEVIQTDLIQIQTNPFSDLTFWDAVISWRDALICNQSLLKKTKDEYLNGVIQIIINYPQIADHDLIDFINNGFIKYQKLIYGNSEWKVNTKRQRLEYLMLIYRHSISNFKFIIPNASFLNKSNEISFRRIKKMLSSARVLEELTLLTSDKIVGFFSRLAEINQRDFFTAKVIWLAQYPLAAILGIKFKNFKENISALGLDENESLDMNAELLYELSPFLYLRFRAELEKIEVQMQYNLESILNLNPRPLKDFLIKILNENSSLNEIFFFQTKTGKCLHSGQLISTMQLASRAAKIGFDITPKILYTHAIAGNIKDRSFALEKMKWTDFYRNINK